MKKKMTTTGSRCDSYSGIQGACCATDGRRKALQRCYSALCTHRQEVKSLSCRSCRGDGGHNVVIQLHKYICIVNNKDIQNRRTNIDIIDTHISYMHISGLVHDFITKSYGVAGVTFLIYSTVMLDVFCI